MVMSNQLSSTHLSSTALLVGLLATSVFGPPAPPPPPLLAEQPFGMVFIADKGGDGLMLTEDGQDYEARIGLKVINNVPLKIVATVSPSDNSGLPNTWSVKLNEPGERQSFHPNSTSNKILGPHEPGAEGDLELCIKVQGVDVGWHAEHQALTYPEVARIAITIIPNP